jgi:hypothetical protein
MSYQQHQIAIEHQRLLRLAREYRQQGYQVTLHPKAEDLPPALAGCPFDLIAKGKGKVIAAEVRTRENLTLNGSEDLRRMTDLVKQVPGWEFELVITNPRRRAS